MSAHLVHNLRLAAVGLVASLFSERQASELMAPRHRVVADRRVGGAAEYLGSPGMVLVSSDGRAVLSRPLDAQLAFYDADGALTGTFGRRGKAPGEFGSLEGTFSRAVLSGGFVGNTLWVYDAVLGRMTMISAGRELIRTWNLPEARPPVVNDPKTGTAPSKPALLSFAPLALYANGEMLARAEFGTREQVRSTILVRPQHSEIVRLHPDGTVGGRVVRIPTDEGSVTVSRRDGLRQISAEIPFFPSPLMATAADGGRVTLVVTEIGPGQRSGLVHLLVVGANGDTLVSRRFSFVGKPLAPAGVDSALKARIARHMNARRGPPGEQTDMVKELETRLRAGIRAVEPPVRQVVLGRDGTIWLALAPTDKEEHPVLQLNERGDPVALLTLPRRPSLVTGNREAVWVTERDDDKLLSVVRYRVAGPM